MNEGASKAVSVSRGELASRAAVQEQRNKPRGVLIAGAVVLVAGFVYLMVGRSALSGAMADRRREVGASSTVLMQTARLERHQASKATTGSQRFDRVPNFTSLADAAAQAVGLTPAPTLTRQEQNTPSGQSGLLERTYQYDRVTSRNLEALIGWVSRVEELVPGVEILRMDLVPQRTQWQLSITFVKPELSS